MLCAIDTPVFGADCISQMIESIWARADDAGRESPLDCIHI